MESNNIEFEKYLGRSIDDLVLINDFELQETELTKDQMKRSSLFQFKMVESYFGIHTESISAFTKNELVSSISLYFTPILDIFFLNKFEKHYSKPNQILKKGKLISETSSLNTSKGFEQNLSKRNYSMEKVSYEDKPDLILWEKHDFSVQIQFDYTNKETSIMFIKATSSL